MNIEIFVTGAYKLFGGQTKKHVIALHQTDASQTRALE
jgi:hypothetical protein